MTMDVLVDGKSGLKSNPREEIWFSFHKGTKPTSQSFSVEFRIRVQVVGFGFFTLPNY